MSSLLQQQPQSQWYDNSQAPLVFLAPRQALFATRERFVLLCQTSEILHVRKTPTLVARAPLHINPLRRVLVTLDGTILDCTNSMMNIPTTSCLHTQRQIQVGLCAGMASPCNSFAVEE